MEHNFNEKKTEFFKGEELQVVLTPKYLESKKKAIDMLDSGLYKGLNDSHFWILMNRTKNGKMAYTGLIISHDGMQIVNDSLSEDKKVKPMCFSTPMMSEYEKDCMYLEYRDDEVYEIGEISKSNCQNAYPYAMLFKRCFDRVVRAKAKLYGIYSEAEADEFKQPIDDFNVYEELKKLYNIVEISKILKNYGVEHIEDLSSDIAMKYYENRKVKK